MFVAVNSDRKSAIEDCRPTIAFYSQSPQYLRYFDSIGCGSSARALQEAFAKGDLNGMIAACSDEMVESIALVGSKDEVLRRAQERLDDADDCTPVVPHYALSQDKIEFYSAGIADLFYR
ncbi:MAG: LLM class flavin-dependent oxidoreductase, partial [Alphaproteobacteria bacterium]|nr:LLM class flavin-dependent oxidoreductase [Alphaproteobacteria bacterium]